MSFTRTDLASEAHALLTASAGALRGVEAHREKLNGLELISVNVLTPEGAQALSKPIGQYYTLYLPPRVERGAPSFSNSAEAIAALIRRCIGARRIDSCLVAALGNPDVTPDALGSLAAASTLVTRHLKSGGVAGFEGFSSCAVLRPGVLGTAGIESAAQIAAIAREVEPGLILVIDALAGTERERLCRCVQVNDSGIAPGSGVGNDRAAISRDTLGVPVIAIGVPTVIDARYFSDAPELAGMFVTPCDIDSRVRAAGRLIGYAVNLALHPDITVETIDALIG